MKFKIQDNRTAARYRPCLHIEALWCTLTLNLLCFLERKKTRQPTQMSVFACNKAVKRNRCLSRNGAQFVFLWRAQIQSSDVWPLKAGEQTAVCSITVSTRSNRSFGKIKFQLAPVPYRCGGDTIHFHRIAYSPSKKAMNNAAAMEPKKHKNIHVLQIHSYHALALKSLREASYDMLLL